MVSIPSNGSIQFLLIHMPTLIKAGHFLRSQSPQTGQFNSYSQSSFILFSQASKVSIPSNGSIQFLQSDDLITLEIDKEICLNPLKRVNSILTSFWDKHKQVRRNKSQSPRTGQFNSYSNWCWDSDVIEDGVSQSPQTGQFNSYNDAACNICNFSRLSSQSPQTGQFNSYRL